MKKNMAVAVGGALGTLARFGLQHIPVPLNASFHPLLTMVINVSGSFILGFLMLFFVKLLPVSAELRIGVTTGFLGGYTTFSTLCKETFFLFQSGHVLLSAAYAGASVLLGLLAAWLGIFCAERLERRRFA